MAFGERAEIVNFVENQYFGSVVRNDIDAVLACFHTDAKILIRHGDNPVRNFSLQPGARESELREFYMHLCGTFSTWFGNFNHVIDFEENRSACYFTVRLTPFSDELLESAGEQELNNCNFFRFRDDKIEHMIIYYSNSGAEAGQKMPTGYPS
jgi:hypothetical protein